MTQQAAMLEGTLRGHITIAAYPSTASTILPPVLGELTRVHPELRLDVVVIDGNEDNARALRAHRVDAAFFINRGAMNSIGYSTHDV